MGNNENERGQDPQQHPSITTATSIQLVPGTPVYDVNGQRLGEVDDPAMDHDALILREGHIFPKDIAIPLSAIASADATSVRLAMTADDVRQERWNPLATVPAIDPDIVSRGTTDIDTGEEVEERGTTDIDRRSDIESRGTTVIEHDASEMTRGTTVRDTGAPHHHVAGGTEGETEAGGSEA
ncbi:MAG TPA: PRC-barrel domain-containing protein [Ktedonobacterales bacterium]